MIDQRRSEVVGTPSRGVHALADYDRRPAPVTVHRVDVAVSLKFDMDSMLSYMVPVT